MKAKDKKAGGRPTEVKGRVVPKYVTLDQPTIDKATALGKGNLSAGLRDAVRRVRVK